MKNRILIYFLAVLIFAGCQPDPDRKNENTKFLQGQAQWITSASKSAEKPTAQEIQQLSFQQVVNDLKIIPSLQDLNKVSKKSTKISLTNISADDLFSEVNVQRLSQKSYQIKTIRKVIDQLKTQDQKTSLSIRLLDKNISFENESVSLVKVFKALMNLEGQVSVPLLNQTTRKLEKFIVVPIGGELNETAKTLIQRSHIEQCHDVLCVLREVMVKDQSQDLVFPQQTASPEDAAYQLLFNALYHRYLIPFYVPRISEFSQQEYQINLRRFETFNTDQIHLISEGLWKLPPTFDQLPSLLYFLADSQDRSRGEVVQPKAILTVIASASAHYYWASHYRPDQLLERWGFVVLNNQQWGRYLNDFQIKLSNGTRNLSNEELIFFEPDIRKRIKRKHLDTVIHEVSHAMDFSRLDQNKDSVPNYKNPYPSMYSLKKEWLGLSQWQYNSSKQTRQLDFYNQLFPNFVSVKVTYLNEWSHQPSANFVNSYSETDPIEDFAVHTAAMVLFPEETTSLTNTKAMFIQKNILTGVWQNNPFEFRFQKEVVSADQFKSNSELIAEKRHRLDGRNCLAYGFYRSTLVSNVHQFLRRSLMNRLKIAFQIF